MLSSDLMVSAPSFKGGNFVGEKYQAKSFNSKSYLSSLIFIGHITGAGFLYKRSLCFESYLFSATLTYSFRISRSGLFGDPLL